MSLFVKVRVRSSYWYSVDAITQIQITGGPTDFVEPAYFVSGPRSIAFNYNEWGIPGDDSSASNEEFVFYIPDAFIEIPGFVTVTWQFGYDNAEIDILTSIDGGTYTLAGTGARVGFGNTLEIELTEAAGPVPFSPWWTDHKNTQEFP